MAAIIIGIVVCGTALAIIGLRLSLLATIPGPPPVGVTTASLRSSDFLSTNAGITFTCGAAAGSFLTLSNAGTAGISVRAATIDWAGQTNGYSLAAGSLCSVGGAGSASQIQNLLFATSTKLLTTATTGGNFTGSATLSNGFVLTFAGTFQ